MTDDTGSSVAAAPDGSVWITGRYYYMTDFAPGATVYNVGSKGGGDAFLWKLRPDQSPTDIGLGPATVLEHSPRGYVVGNLSAADPDGGDLFTYELLDSAGGRFKIVGSQVQVAEEYLLDPPAGTSMQIVVRARDSFAKTFEKAISIEWLPRLRASGRVWNDLNGNGVQDAGEPGVAGVVAEVRVSTDAVVGDADDASLDMTCTDADGHYLLRGLVAGVNYYLCFRTPPGYTFTSQDTGGDDARDSDATPVGYTAMFTLPPGTNSAGIDAGLPRRTAPVRLRAERGRRRAFDRLGRRWQRIHRRHRQQSEERDRGQVHQRRRAVLGTEPRRNG